MQELILQNIAKDTSFDSLPAVWRNFDLKSFSNEKTLYNFQQEALESALKILWRYYEERFDYNEKEEFSEKERLEKNQNRKKYLFEFYQNSPFFPKKGIDYNLEKKEEKKSVKLLEEFYSVIDNKITFDNFINRMAFWMATGSGKTLVIIKLMKILGELIQAKEIPQNDILYLTCRDDLIKQFKTFVKEFNSFYQNEIKINLESLKEYAKAKRNLKIKYDKEITIFYYRSDNLSDKGGDKIIDFRTIENQGKWYVLLDEAHKGDSDDSKRKAIYSILSRNGFLFNFSATFVDPRDFLTTAYNFNLKKFIQEGYGKHIYLSAQDIKAFKDKTEFSKIEKQKVVLKSLILLTYIKKFAHKVKRVKKNLYHYPLLLTLVNSVNTEDADLKLFFREIEKIGQGKANQEIFQKAKEEILEEFGKENKFQFEETGFEINKDVISKIEYQDVLEEVFNSKNSGGIEVLKIPGNRKELIFKLKKSEKPFALIKIGDISGWLKDQLEGYEINESFDNRSVFEQINRDDSEINILMGSRTFYEGWDSNRPNIILFINIGVGTKAKKFVLQSTGRGIRIEPEENKRKRISHLFNAYPKKVDGTIYHKIRKFVLPLETLFIFGTKPKNLEEIVRTFDIEKGSGQNIGKQYIKENPEVKKRLLLVPIYKLSTRILAEEEKPAKFSIYPDDFSLTKNYFDYLEDDRVRLMYYDNDIRNSDKVVQTLKAVKTSFWSERGRYHLDKSVSQISNPNFILSQIFYHFSLVPEKFERFDKVVGKIVHFEKIEFKPEEGKELKKLLGKIEKVSQYKKEEKRIKQLKISFKDKEELLSSRKKQLFDGIKIEYVPNHYYFPVILLEKGDKINYLNHIINVKSEVKFIEDLEDYLRKENNLFKKRFEWWLFSKIDQTTDDVFIPWYNSKIHSIDHYHPDFIFWLKEKNSNNYYIVFVDPHGTEHTEYEYKVQGYQKIFEDEGGPKTFTGEKYGLPDNLEVKVFLFMATERNYNLPREYEKYWFQSSDIESLLSKVLKNRN